MKRFLPLLILVLSGLAVSNQSSGQAPDWTRMLQVSTAGMQYGDAVTADANYVYAAASISGQVTADMVRTSVGLRDMLLIKMQNDSDMEWIIQVDAGAGGSIQAQALKVDGSGNIFVTGFFSGTATIGLSTITSDASYNAFLAKFDADGNGLWAAPFLFTGSGPSKIALDASGNIYLLSRSTKLIKISSSGVIQWEQSYANKTLQAVAVYGTNLYVGGALQSGTTTFGTIDLESLGGSNTGFIVKADLDGNYTGSMRVLGSGESAGSTVTDIIFDGSGNLIITGCYTDDLVLGDITINNEPVASHNYTYIAKCSDSFVFSWAHSSDAYQNYNSDYYSYRMFMDVSGKIYEYGPAVSPFDYETVTVETGNAPFLVRFDSDGVPEAGYPVYGSGAPRIFVSPAALVLVTGSHSAPGNPNYGNIYIQGYGNDMTLYWEILTSDSQSGTVQIRNSRVDAAGNTYIQARVLGYCDYFGTIINTTNYLTVISKHDYDGNLIWMKQINDIPADLFGPSFILDNENNVLYTGTFYGSINVEYQVLNSSTSGAEGYIAKFDSEDGDLWWAHTANYGSDVYKALSVASDSQDNVIFSGVLPSGGSNFIQKFNPEGSKAWDYVWPMGSNYLSLVSTDASDNIYLASEIHLASGPVYIGSVVLSQTTDDGSTVLVKFDPDGTPLWAKTYGGVTGAAESDGWPTDINNDADGNTYLWGWCLNNAEFDAFTLTNPFPVPASYSFYLTKIDQTGNVIWAHGVYESTNYGYNYGDVMDLDADGNVYVGGHFRVNKINIQGTEFTPAGSCDFFTAKFANDGTFEWIKTVPSNGNICYSIDVSDEDVVTIGSYAGKDAALGAFPYERKGGPTGIVATMGALSYITVTAGDPIIIDAPLNSTGTFTIASNTSWTIESGHPWLVPDVSSGSGNATITLTAQEHTANSYRIANVNVLKDGSVIKEVFVVQVGVPISSFPYTEDFTTYPPADWIMEDKDIDWEHYNSSAVFADFWNNPPPAEAEMGSPIFDFTALDNPEINIRWSHKYYTGQDDEFRIEVYTDGPDWTEVWSKSGSELDSRDGAQNEAPGSYTTTSINLSALCAGKPFVMIRFIGVSDYGPSLYIDQVVIYNGVKAAPEAVTGPAVYAYYDQAVITGMVTPNSAETAITFEYGPTDAYGTTVSAVPSAANGSVPVTAYYFMDGLTPGATYHYRIVAVNSEGTDYGDDATFTPEGCERIDYTTTSEGGTYTDLETNGTVISTADFDDANSAPVEIGFTFNYNCQDFTQFILNTNGFIKLGAAPPSSASLFYSGTNTQDGVLSSQDPADVNILAPFTYDLTAGTLASEYRVYTTGIAPDRICTIQFKNLSDKPGTSTTQYENISFQIKLYETSNVIEFVYGTWGPSANPSSAKSAECGIKGSVPVNDHLITVSKSSVSDWSSVTFLHKNYTDNALNFGNPPERPVPDAGRTFRFTPAKNFDATVVQVYTLTKMPLASTTSHQVSAIIRNVGYNQLIDITVNLSITGANSFSDSYVIPSLDPNVSTLVTFMPFTPSAAGDNVVTVTVEDDENNLNNSRSIGQQVNSDTYSYAVGSYVSGAIYYYGLTLSKFNVAGARVITDVDVFISSNLASIGNTVYAVVLDAWGNLAGRSADLVIAPEDLGKMHNFEILAPPVVTDQDFYAGLACTAPIGETYYPIAVQTEIPVRPDTYFYSDYAGGFLYSAGYRFITEAVAAEPYLNVSTNTLTIDQPGGSTETFEITSNMSWSAWSSQSWLTTSESNGSRNSTITLTAEENSTGSDRYATVTAQGALGLPEEISVTQAGLATKIDDTVKTPEIKIYPNPNKGRFTLDMNGTAYDKLRIVVTNSVGLVVRDILLDNQAGRYLHEIEPGNLSGGIYFINIITDKMSTVKMFVVQ